jgi:SAM-dependent methyltransferase
LDLGCGKRKPSIYMQNMYPKIKEFIGIDISKKSIDIANLNLKKIKKKNKFSLLNKKILFIEQDIFDYEFKNEKNI